MVAQYYRALRSILREKPHLQSCLARCRHCGILFITHPRNAGRQDLGCPFGCREAHRKMKAAQRSTDYYRTEEGKFKKKRLNDRRQHAGPPTESAGVQPAFVLDLRLLVHLQMVVGFIEGRSVSLEEMVLLAVEFFRLRQHSIDFGKKRRYQCVNPQKSPP